MPKLVDYNSKVTTTYQLGLGNLLLIAAGIPLIFVALGFNISLPITIKAVLIIVTGIFGERARAYFNQRYQISPRPLIQNRNYQAGIGILGFALLGLFNRIIVVKELSLLSFTGTDTLSLATSILFLGGSALVEETLFRYMIFAGLFLAMLRITHNYAVSGLTGMGLSSYLFQAYHYFVYGDVTSIVVFIFISGILLSAIYWLTGNIVLTMGIHFFWNTLGPFVMLVAGSGVCIPGVTC